MSDPRAIVRTERTVSLASARGRVTRLRLACRPPILLLPANVSFVHAVIKRKGDAARGGHTESQEGP
jgi:hypothetical protein